MGAGQTIAYYSYQVQRKIAENHKKLDSFFDMILSFSVSVKSPFIHSLSMMAFAIAIFNFLLSIATVLFSELLYNLVSTRCS